MYDLINDVETQFFTIFTKHKLLKYLLHLIASFTKENKFIANVEIHDQMLNYLYVRFRNTFFHKIDQ